MDDEPARSKIKIPGRINSQYVRRTRGLILTYQCNLDCVYCYVQNKRDKVMPLDIAQKAITDVFCPGKEPGFDEIEIDFIGAEPLTAFERLQEISEWVWRQIWCRPYILFATTNGTLLTDEMKRWFNQNKYRIYLGLSYDGITETQNRNRSNSADAVDLNFFLENWPEQHLKMTITEATVADLADSIIHLHKRGFRIAANPAHGMKQWNAHNIREYGRQLLKLADFYLANPNIPRSSLFSLDLTKVFGSSNQ